MSQKDDKLEAARAAATETAQKAAAAAAEIGGKVSEAASGLFNRLRRTVHEVTEDGGMSEADALIKELVAANGNLQGTLAAGLVGEAHEAAVARYNKAYSAIQNYAQKLA